MSKSHQRKGQANDPSSPIYQWNPALVKEPLRNLTSGKTVAAAHSSYPLTLKNIKSYRFKPNVASSCWGCQALAKPCSLGSWLLRCLTTICRGTTSKARWHLTVVGMTLTFLDWCPARSMHRPFLTTCRWFSVFLYFLGVLFLMFPRTNLAEPKTLIASTSVTEDAPRGPPPFPFAFGTNGGCQMPTCVEPPCCLEHLPRQNFVNNLERF